MRFFFGSAARMVSLMAALAVWFTVSVTASLPAGVDVALASPAKSCTSGGTTAPFLSSGGGRSPRVSGSVLVVTRDLFTTLSTPGAIAPRTTRPRVGLGKAWLAFCVQGGRVAGGAALVTTRAGGISVVATGARQLALTQTTGRWVRKVRRIALTARPQLVQVVLDRTHQGASLLVNGRQTASVRATIRASTVVTIGSANHPVRRATVTVPSVADPSSTNAAPLRTPAPASPSSAPGSATTGTGATAARDGNHDNAVLGHHHDHHDGERYPDGHRADLPGRTANHR